MVNDGCIPIVVDSWCLIKHGTAKEPEHASTEMTYSLDSPAWALGKAAPPSYHDHPINDHLTVCRYRYQQSSVPIISDHH